MSLNGSYRAQNLLIPCMTPGPEELTAEQLHTKIIVDDLLELYNDGVNICTQLFPNSMRTL